MPDEPNDAPADDAADADDTGGMFSPYGVASAALAAVAVAAVVLATLIWSGHRDEVDERRHQTRVLQTAAEWAGGLVNMNKDNVAENMARLQENTIGELNADFDSAVAPYRQLVQTLQARTRGQVDSVAIETLHHAVGPDGNPAPRAPADPQLSAFASRTDTVLVVATSVSENAAGEEPRTVRWNLRLDVSDVDGKLMISRLEPIR